MACEEKFCTNYLVLDAEKASLFDLICILLSNEVEKRTFIDLPETEKLRGLRRRWLIFISVLLQKILLYLKWPMAQLGFVLEFCINLSSSNGGNFASLVLNLLRGEVVKPDKSSQTFMSLVGNLDKRVELDKIITNGDIRYWASLSIMAAKLSYENENYVQKVIRDIWKMEFLGFYNFWNAYQEQASTQAIMFQNKTADPDLIVVSFRGTEPFDADGWRTDVDLSWYELEGVGKVHGGFMKALGLQKIKGWPKQIPQGPNQPLYAYYTIREKVREILEKNEKAKFILTGHSLGGALAIIFGAVLSLHEEAWLLDRLEGVYTFGQPRVGDEKFGEFMKEKLKVYDVRYFRYVYCNDVVPRLPYDDRTLLFKHFGPCLYYNSFYQGKIMGEEPNKNYFSLLWAIPNYLNAVWELTRSFIIPYTRGAEYKEGLFMRLVRVIGLAIPGLSAHSPPDYVNLTRLGSLPLNHPDLLTHQKPGLKHE